MFTQTDSDGYAYLPDELLEAILRDAPEVTRSIETAYMRIQSRRDTMRQELSNQQRILKSNDLDPVGSPSVAAVDGGLAIEKSIGADTIIAAAVGVEGITREDRRKWSGVQHLHWKNVIAHGGESARNFGLGVMAALELRIAVHAPHDVIIFDGSHVTPIIGLNSMLGIDIDELVGHAATLFGTHDILRNLNQFFRRSNIVSLVKYDSSRELAETWFAESTLDDKSIMTMILEAGEFTQPVEAAQTRHARQQVHDYHIRVKSDQFPDRTSTNAKLEDAIFPAKRGEIYVTYFRPRLFAPALRIELKKSAAESSTMLATILQAVKEQVISPEIKEPYPQFLADQMAKSVGSGLRALHAAVAYEIAGSGASELLSMLMQPYRTD